MNLRVVNLNLGMLPFPLGIRHNCRRVNTLLNKILMMDNENLPDVICFQELTSRIARHKVIQGLKDLYPHRYVDTRTGKYLVGVNSGLAIFSRYPILNTMIKSYTVYRGVENFARKGIMGVRLEIDKFDKQNVLYSGTVCIFTTHLQAGIGDEPCVCKWFDSNHLSTNELKTRQVEEAADYINEFVYSDEPVIFCGDFNIPSAEELYPMLTEVLGEECRLYDTFSGEDSEVSSSVIGKQNKRIDYQFINDTVIEGKSVIKTYFGPYGEVTDHYAAFGDYELEI